MRAFSTGCNLLIRRATATLILFLVSAIHLMAESASSATEVEIEREDNSLFSYIFIFGIMALGILGYRFMKSEERKQEKKKAKMESGKKITLHNRVGRRNPGLGKA